MEADYFSILGLRPGRYSPEAIDRQYDSVRREILHAGGLRRQQRLDDAMIAHVLLRQPRRQAALARLAERRIAAQPRRQPARVPRAVLSARPSQGVPRIRRRAVEPVSPPRAPGAVEPDVYARFARTVCEHLESGLLRFTARQRLMRLAEGLGIGEFKANLIIAEVLHDVRYGRPDPAAGVGGPLVVPEPSSAQPGYGLQLFLAIAAALLADALLLAWLAR